MNITTTRTSASPTLLTVTELRTLLLHAPVPAALEEPVQRFVFDLAQVRAQIFPSSLHQSNIPYRSNIFEQPAARLYSFYSYYSYHLVQFLSVLGSGANILITIIIYSYSYY